MSEVPKTCKLCSYRRGGESHMSCSECSMLYWKRRALDAERELKHYRDDVDDRIERGL